MPRSLLFALLIAAAAATTPALADGDAPAEAPPGGVMDRARPDYDAKGLPLGAFRLKPALDVGAAADDNVFATQTNTVSDTYFTIRPSFDLASQWSRHQLDITGSLTRYQYLDQSGEDRTDWNLGASGRVDVLRGTDVTGEADYAVNHEPRYSPDEPGTASEPTRYSQFHASAAITHQPASFGIQIGATYDKFNYFDTPLLGGGTVSNDDRDEHQLEAFAKIIYELTPDTSVFLRGAYDAEHYDLDIDRFGFDRDSNRYRIDAGFDFFATRLVKGEIFAGYVDDTFKAPLADISTFDYGAKLDWFATELMTFHLKVVRALDDTIIDGASVSDDQTASLGLDWEVLRNVIVHAGGDYTRSRFVGTERRDTLWGAGVSVQYLINEYMSANLGYRYVTRSSNAPGEDFNDNQVMAGLHFQL